MSRKAKRELYCSSAVVALAPHHLETQDLRPACPRITRAFVSVILEPPSQWGLASRRAAIRNPAAEQFDVRLRPGAVAKRRGRRHHSATNSADPVVDGPRAGFHRLVVGKVERPAHALNVALGEQRTDVDLEACLVAH